MNIFRRFSHAEIDEIDSVLNALVQKHPYQVETEAVSHVIDTHTQAMSAMRTDPAASGPAAGTWNNVLRATAQPAAKGCQEMSTTATLRSPMSGVAKAPANTQPRGFLNIAASILAVAAIAMGGWFAAMNLLPTSDGNNGIAFAPSTPTSGEATCDVAPLTVDEVMQIVKNPYAFAASRNDPTAERLGPEYRETTEGPTTAEYFAATRTKPAEKDFDRALAVANSYLACLPSASWGQIWALSDPSWVQRSILAHFPVYANETEVHGFVEGRIDQPLSTDHNPLDDVYTLMPGQAITANPDIDSARAVWPGSSSGDQLLFIEFGVLVTDEQGNIVLKSNSQGASEKYQTGSSKQRPRIVIGQSSTDGNWYIAPFLGSYWVAWEYDYSS